MTSKSKGFTLVELLIVIAILGILASIALLRYGPMFEKAKASQAYAVLSQIVSSEKRYFLENSAYTATITDLDAFDTAIPARDFTFSIPSVDVTTGYAMARNITGANSYKMCFNSSAQYTCSVYNDCSAPACP